MGNLEQALYTPRQVLDSSLPVYRAADLERLSVLIFYTRDIKLTSKGFIMPLGNLNLKDCGIKDVHETYRLDKLGNLLEGHTTFTSKYNIKKRIDHD
jgi:hypothetical protein